MDAGYYGSLVTSGTSALVTRKYKIGVTISKDAVVVTDRTAARLGHILDPTSATDYADAVGIALQDGTYSTTQGVGTASANIEVEVSISPFSINRGRISGTAAESGAFSAGLDGNLLTNSTAETAGTVVADTDVGTSEFVGGSLFALTGANGGGNMRIITSHVDNTSTTVAVPFDNDIAANDTFLRLMGALDTTQGRLSTLFTQFAGSGAAARDLPDTGNSLILDVTLDISDQGTPAAPLAFAAFIFNDHAFNRID